MAQKNERSRLWNAVLYPDDPTHAQALEHIKSDFQFVGILHDKDTNEDGTPKKAHYHIILKFGQARWLNSIASDLGIASNYLERCRNFEASAKYLTHEDCDGKAPYEASELFGPLVPAVNSLLSKDDENVRVLRLLSLIEDAPYLTFAAAVRLACENGLYSDLRRMGVIGTKIIHQHNYEIGGPDYLD